MDGVNFIRAIKTKKQPKINHRAPLLTSLGAGCLFELFAFFQKQLTAVFQQNFYIPKIVHHATFDGQGSQGAAQNQPVKTAKMPDDLFFILCYKVVHGVLLRVRAKINSQILSVEAPGWQGAKVQEYQAYSELSQRSQAGCISAKNVKLFLREP